MEQWLALVRDLLLVLVALSSFIALLLVIKLFFEVRALLKLVHTEITPILGSVKRTASTVEGTTRFIGQRALGPLVTFVGILVTLRRVLQVLSGGGRR